MANPASYLNVLNGTETTQPLLLGSGTTFNGRPLSGGGANVVNVTVTTLAVTAALHAGKTIVIDAAAPLTITLPAATGTGDEYEFIINTAATTTPHTINAASATDVMAGTSWVLTTASANVIGYAATATSAIISLNGTTLGGVKGDKVVLIDVKASVWSAQLYVQATGSTATPFAHG